MIAFIAGHSPATRRRNLDSSPGSRAAPSSGMPSCPVEAHMASRGAASTSRMGRPAPRRRSSAQRGFLRAARSRRRDDDESDSASASPAVKVEDAVTSPSSVSGHAADAGDDAADAGKASDRTARVNPPPRSTSKKLRWSKADDELLRRTVERMGARNWREIAKVFGGRRTDVQCLHRCARAPLQQPTPVPDPMLTSDAGGPRSCARAWSRVRGLRRRTPSCALWSTSAAWPA